MNKPQKIRVTPDMIINDMGLEKVSNFFCEFDTDGDPLYGIEPQIPKVHPRHDHWWVGQTDLAFTVELDAIYQITNIYIYNDYDAYKPEKDKADYGVRKVRVKMGTPFSWEYNEELAPEQRKWTGFEASFKTQYINFSFNNNQAPSEIIIYGYKVEDVEKIIPERKEHKRSNLSKLVGMNGFVNDGDDVLRACTYIREYHPWIWTCNPDGMNTAIKVNPSFAGQWNFDEYYQRLHSHGIDVAPTLSTHNKRGPKDNTCDPCDPKNYLSYAAMLFQYVARYGHNKDIDPELIKVCEGEEKKIGLGYLSAVEPLNEPDGTWLGRDPYFTPFEMAAFLSICYDGHEGMYKNVGVKQADPNFIMSMSGGAGLSYDRLRAVEFWCQYNRKDKSLPFDVINAHCYCGKCIYKSGKTKNVDVNIADRGEQLEKVYVGISPEEGDIVGRFDKIIEWRDRYYPHMEIWLTEFGWDTNQSYETSTSAHAYGDFTGRQVQGIWLVREYLLLSSIGIERAAMYMSRDCGPEETSVGKYGSCGLIRHPIEISATNVIQGNKKDSFYYVYTLKEILKDTSFDKIVKGGEEKVWVYQYVKEDGKRVWAVWCPSSDNTKVEGYKLSVGEGDYLVASLAFERYNGLRKDLENENGTVTINVSESPVFVIEK